MKLVLTYVRFDTHTHHRYTLSFSFYPFIIFLCFRYRMVKDFILSLTRMYDFVIWSLIFFWIFSVMYDKRIIVWYLHIYLHHDFIA